MRLPRVQHPLLELRRVRLLPTWVRRMDAVANRAVNGRRTHPALDRAYTRLSNSANRSRLWLAFALLLVLFDRRRAAVRGVASLTVASILANLVGKRIFGGDRPLLKDVPLPRQLKKYPTSASFPSGHSASAAGFAVGVALESPRSAAIIAPFAAAVAYSRLHVSAHWFSDVLGGLALGAGVAAVGKVLVPASPTTSRQAAASGTVIQLASFESGEGVLILVNPLSGASTHRPDPVPLLAERLPKASIHCLDDGDDPGEIVRLAMATVTPPTVLGVVGGDGSAAAGASLAREHGLPLLLFPGGTFNHFARAVGLETIEDTLAALRVGVGRQVDVAELRVDEGEPITVLNAASVGLYPDFVAERERRERQLGKWLAALVAAIRVLRTARPLFVDLEGRRARVWSVFVGVNRNVPEVVSPMRRARLDDGRLDVRILHARSRAHAVASLSFGRRTSALVRALLLPGDRSTVDTFEATSVQFGVCSDSAPAIGVGHDGEVEPAAVSATGAYRVSVRNVPGGLDVYAPTPAGPERAVS